MHFIVLEGGEGVGKSTQGRLLTQWLADREIPFCAAREPGGTPMGEAVRDIFLHRNEVNIDPEAELLLVLAARVASVRDVVRPALERREVVIMDRFDFSTLAYQGYGRGVELDVIRRINDFAARQQIQVLYYTVQANVEAQRELGRDLRIGENFTTLERAIGFGPGVHFLRLVDHNPRAMFSDHVDHLTPDGIATVAAALAAEIAALAGEE